MTVYGIDIQIDDAYAEAVQEEGLRRALEVTLESEEQDGVELTLVITGNDEIQALNRDFGDNDVPTDVLSFSAREGGAFVLPDEAAPYLGDIIISYPTALAQATLQGHAVAEELVLLAVHGCLHLLGYDHAEESQRELMWQRQDGVLARLRTA